MTATAGQHHRHRDLALRNVNLPARRPDKEEVNGAAVLSA
jgi:hypothetical protein